MTDKINHDNAWVMGVLEPILLLLFIAIIGISYMSRVPVGTASLKVLIGLEGAHGFRVSMFGGVEHLRADFRKARKRTSRRFRATPHGRYCTLQMTCQHYFEAT